MYIANPDKFLFGSEQNIGEALQHIDKTGINFIVCVDDQNKFVSLITEGDLRRVILEGHPLSSSLPMKKSITACVNTSYNEALTAMQANNISVLPVLTLENKVLFIISAQKLRTEYTGLIMAGGKGKRLRPLTDEQPKPLLMVGNKCLIDFTLDAMTASGVNSLEVSINYKKEMIIDHLESKIEGDYSPGYLVEDEPLGTCGAIALSKQKDTDFLISNADIITDLNLLELIWEAKTKKLDLVVATRIEETRLHYGVVKTEDQKVVQVEEKPVLKHRVAAGIYFVCGKLAREIQYGYLDMPDFIRMAISENYDVGFYDIEGEWLDVGRIEQLELAREQKLQRPGT